VVVKAEKCQIQVRLFVTEMYNNHKNLTITNTSSQKVIYKNIT